MKFNIALTVITLLSIAGSCSAVKHKFSKTELTQVELETVARLLIRYRKPGGAFNFEKLPKYVFTEHELIRLTNMKKNGISNEQLFQNILNELQAAKDDEVNPPSKAEKPKKAKKKKQVSGLEEGRSVEGHDDNAGESNGTEVAQKLAGDTDPGNKADVVDPPEDIDLTESKEGVKKGKDENSDLSNKQADVSDSTSSPSDVLALHTEIAPPKLQQREDVESNDMKKEDVSSSVEDTNGTTGEEVVRIMSEAKNGRARRRFRRAAKAATNSTNLSQRLGFENKDNSATSTRIEEQKDQQPLNPDDTIIEAALAEVFGNHGGQGDNYLPIADLETKREIDVDSGTHIVEPLHNSAVDNVKETKQTDVTELPIQVEVHTSGINETSANSNDGTTIFSPLLKLNDNPDQEIIFPTIEQLIESNSGATTTTTSNDLNGEDSHSAAVLGGNNDAPKKRVKRKPRSIELPQDLLEGMDMEGIFGTDESTVGENSTDPNLIKTTTPIKTDEPETVDPKKLTELADPEKKINGTETTENVDPNAGEPISVQKGHFGKYKIWYFGAVALSVISIAAYFLVNKFENDETDL